MASALEQLLNLLHGNGHDVELHVKPEEEPLIEDPIKHNEPRFDPETRAYHKGVPAMKRMTPEGAALMKLMQAHGVDIGPEDFYNTTNETLQRIPYGRTIGEGGTQETI